MEAAVALDVAVVTELALGNLISIPLMHSFTVLTKGFEAPVS